MSVARTDDVDTSEMHRLIGELTAEMRGVRAAIDTLHEDFQCVPERLTSLEEWRKEWDERSRRLAGARWTFGVSVVLLAVKEAWDWLHHLFTSRT